MKRWELTLHYARKVITVLVLLVLGMCLLFVLGRFQPPDLLLLILLGLFVVDAAIGCVSRKRRIPQRMLKMAYIRLREKEQGKEDGNAA